MDLLNSIANNRTWNKHGIVMVWTVTLLSLLAAFLYIGWGMHSNAKIRQANYLPQPIKPIAVSSVATFQVRDIVTANLFGDPSPKPVVKKAPKTTLDLTLQGILSATDPNLARAIIMTGRKKSELYSVGENITGAGASVKEIRATEVLLDRSGATESLPLLKKTTSGDRQIISYSEPLNNQEIIPNPVQRNNRSNNASQHVPNKSTRKIRKPNFSGLDRALKKMGDL